MLQNKTYPNLHSLALLFVATLSCVIGVSAPLNAATYYCSPIGDDNRSPAQAQSRSTPFRTIQRAIALAADNDTIVVLNGSYAFPGAHHPSYETYANSSFRNLLDVSANALTIRSEVKWGATLLGPVRLAGLTDLRFEGFRISPFFTANGPSAGLSLTGCSNPLVRDCYIESDAQTGIAFTDCDWIQAEWNIVTYGNTSLSFQPGTAISVSQPRYQAGPSRPWGVWLRNNTIFGTSVGVSLSIDDGTLQLPPTNYDRPCMVENNLVFDLNEAESFAGASTSALEVVRFKNVRIRNNTLVRDFGFEGIPMISIRNSDGVYVYNNIVAARNQTPTFDLAGNTETLVFANVVEGTEVPAEVELMNYIGSPQFDPGTLTPSASSPAVNNAFDAGDHYFLDVSGGPRFNGPLDIGALER